MPYDDINPNSPDPKERERAALYTRDLDILTKLARDPNADVRKAVTRQWRLPAQVAAILLKDKDHDIAANTISSCAYDYALFSEAAQHASADVRFRVAYREETPADLLTILANDSDQYVRAEAAQHKNTPYQVIETQVLDALNRAGHYTEDDERYLSSVILNRNVPHDILTTIYNTNPQKFDFIYSNLNCPPAILTAMYIRETPDRPWEQTARQRAIINRYNDRQFPDIIYTHASTHPLADIRESLASNHHLPDPIATKLANDKSIKVRAALASNKTTLTHLLTQLAADKNATVSRAALNNPNTPDTTKNEAAANPAAQPKTPLEEKFDAILNAETPEQLTPYLTDKMKRAVEYAHLRAHELGMITATEAIQHLGYTSGALNTWLDLRTNQLKEQGTPTNPVTPANKLIELAATASQDWVIRRLLTTDNIDFTENQLIYIAQHPNTPVSAWTILQIYEEISNELYEALTQAAPHNHPGSIMNTADFKAGQANPAPGEIWYDTHVTRDPRLALITRTDTPPHIVTKLLAENTGKHFKAAYLRRPDSTPEEIAKAATSGNDALRLAAAQHPNTTVDTLTRLAGDKDPKIRAAVLRHPKVTDEMKTIAALLK